MTKWRKLVTGAALALLAATPFPLFARRHPPATGRLTGLLTDTLNDHQPGNPVDGSADVPRVRTTKSGILQTKDGLRLQFHADMGNVRIFTDAAGQVSYRVTVDADARDPAAKTFPRAFFLAAQQVPAGTEINGSVTSRNWRGRLQVNYEIHIPRRYNLEVNTQAGNIDVQDIDGRVTLITAGGNVTTGRVGGAAVSANPAPDNAKRVAAQIETQGGHITTGDVAGDLHATTAGGHITAGNIEGDAILQTVGGHIYTGRIQGVATLDTGGGNIHVERADSNVTANTGGGQIDFGEAAGAIRAHTGGGAVRIEQVSGPTAVEASGGSVFLRQVNGPLRVSAATGNITAWFTGAREVGSTIIAKGIRKMNGPAQLVSDEGDIIVYLPRELAVTIDALVEQGAAHSIVADSSLPLRVRYQDSSSGTRAVHCEGNLNGGGEVLHLKAVSGNIVLKLGEPGSETGMPVGPQQPVAPVRVTGENTGEDYDQDAEGFIEEIRRMFEASWWGAVPVDSDEMQKRLENMVTPIYPEVARRAGIEGDVVLRAYVSIDDRVTSVEVLSGPPVLARAALRAVQQWRYQPVEKDGQPIGVVTTLTVAFRLQPGP